MTRSDTIASLAVNSWINVGWVIVPRANLRGADLRWANLRGADLRWANLSGANLFGCDLTEADLFGCDLTEAYLRGARTSGARITLGNRTFTLTEETAR
jgi:uncharacterized protein YjbI with pentapeptide repeats